MRGSENAQVGPAVVRYGRTMAGEDGEVRG